MIYQIGDVMMSIMMSIEYIFWTTTHYITELGQLIDINKNNNFQELLEQFGGLKLSSRPFSI